MPSDGHTALIAFNPGGMGPNHSDIASMVLLPELLYRHAFGQSLLRVPSEWAARPGRLPILHDGAGWTAASKAWVPPVSAQPLDWLSSRPLCSLARRLPTPVKGLLKGARAAMADWHAHGGPTARQDLHWQPALRYRRHWPRMPAFALPSFYDGRIRLNLRGRERDGMIEPSRYPEACAAIASILGECRNPRTGEPAVDSIEYADTRDPLALAGSEADLIVVWRGVVGALEHPRLGLVGPVPLRRTGGHTGRYGTAYVLAPGLEPGDRGVRSAFDVAPTIAALLGERPPPHMSGQSLL
jgi:predicted AlkP superfamily phosphohydrolase/phosphomutase